MVKLQEEFRTKILSPTMSQNKFCQQYNIDPGNFSRWLRNMKSSPASANAVARALRELEPVKDNTLGFVIVETANATQIDPDEDEMIDDGEELSEMGVVLDCSICYRELKSDFLSCPQPNCSSTIHRACLEKWRHQGEWNQTTELCGSCRNPWSPADDANQKDVIVRSLAPEILRKYFILPISAREFGGFPKHYLAVIVAWNEEELRVISELHEQINREYKPREPLKVSNDDVASKKFLIQFCVGEFCCLKPYFADEEADDDEADDEEADDEEGLYEDLDPTYFIDSCDPKHRLRMATFLDLYAKFFF
eukprot:c52791_g1_i1.p1 GENE.c52791_g1_i1~~c52791_g1_i1.p1  ORF type:complete len:321 (+),score=76.07 c52791_g1_i1:40-963(+)